MKKVTIKDAIHFMKRRLTHWTDLCWEKKTSKFVRIFDFLQFATGSLIWPTNNFLRQTETSENWGVTAC